jgi:hypothetical protein
LLGLNIEFNWLLRLWIIFGALIEKHRFIFSGSLLHLMVGVRDKYFFSEFDNFFVKEAVSGEMFVIALELVLINFEDIFDGLYCLLNCLDFLKIISFFLLL